MRLFQNGVTRRFDGLVEPFTHVSVDLRGNYWTYSPELGLGSGASKFFLGNCRFDRLSDAAISQRFLDLRAAVESGIRLCETSCNYFEICGGGAQPTNTPNLAASTGRKPTFQNQNQNDC